jgi:hypothetical protein
MLVHYFSFSTRLGYFRGSRWLAEKCFRKTVRGDGTFDCGRALIVLMFEPMGMMLLAVG